MVCQKPRAKYLAAIAALRPVGGLEVAARLEALRPGIQPMDVRGGPAVYISIAAI